MNIDRMDLIETFVRIAEAGSMSRAAEHLNTSQATISRKLKKLEEVLAQSLINRSTGGLTLTDTGERFFEEARDMVNRWYRLEGKYGGERHSLSGALKIVAPVGMGQHFMADIAIGFYHQNPDIAITWITQDESVDFSEVGCDLWIRLDDQQHKNLMHQQLATTRRAIVATPELIDKRSVHGATSVGKLPCVALKPIDGERLS